MLLALMTIIQEHMTTAVIYNNKELRNYIRNWNKPLE